MSKKLLLADDSITIQKVIGITFAHEDYQLSVVDNGDAALQKARETHPDLILADVLMPGMNGYDLCAAVKQDPLLKAVPVLLLAGTFEPFDEAKAKEVAADSWIAKPFSSQALIDQVQTLLQQAGQQQEEAPQDIGLEDVAEILDTPAVESDIWAEVAEPSADAETSFADIEASLLPWPDHLQQRTHRPRPHPPKLQLPAAGPGPWRYQQRRFPHLQRARTLQPRCQTRRQGIPEFQRLRPDRYPGASRPAVVQPAQEEPEPDRSTTAN